MNQLLKRGIVSTVLSCVMAISPAASGLMPGLIAGAAETEESSEKAGHGSSDIAAAEDVLPQDPDSVVALSKSIGDLWLLAGGQLSGITDDGLDLEGIGEAQAIGSLAKPSMESILALDPDLVLLTSDIPTHAKVAEELTIQQIPVVKVTIGSFADYDSYMKEFTDVTGREDLYAKYVTDVKADIDDVISSSGIDLSGKTYLELRVSATKNKALKDDYFASEIFNDFGLKNIASDDSGLDDLSVEAILAQDPDYIFVIPQGKEDEAEKAYEEAFTSDPAWETLSAVKSGQVYTMPKDLFQYKPNARWAEAYQYVAGLLGGLGETEE